MSFGATQNIDDMDINQQIQMLVQQAPQYGASPKEVEAIAPALITVADRLKHPEYYVLQTLEQNWVMTVLNHPTESEVTKNILSVFPTLEDAKTSASEFDNAHVIAVPVPVVHILFQMLAMEPVDSIIFFEQPREFTTGVEVTRADLLELVQISLQTMRSRTPTDIA
ncbi:MAG: hypothetical protein KME11_09550 [Timaviella obliquedivisa GSE-PSE-MK23-08B]|nr:hypothetical protein [Timaviella obliquedivisa GSE-PSE-MK23-08B]